MSFFTAPNDEVLDLVTENMMNRGAFDDRYDAIKELREINQQGLSLSPGEAARANGFFRVASLQGELESLAKLLDPEWMRDKRRFYRWLDKHPQHVAYDRRKDARSTQITMFDGKVVT